MGLLQAAKEQQRQLDIKVEEQYKQQQRRAKLEAVKYAGLILQTAILERDLVPFPNESALAWYFTKDKLKFKLWGTLSYTGPRLFVETKVNGIKDWKPINKLTDLLQYFS
jgi:hypothetical protein